MSIDFENLGAAPDIDNFDATTLDRGDAIVAADPEPKDDPAPKEEPKDEPVDDPKDEDPAEDPKDEPEDEEPDEQPRDEKGKFTGKGIPKARFDEAVGKERDAREAAERRAAELERQLKVQEVKQAQTVELTKLEEGIETLETKHAELLLDGDTAGAAKIMKEIRMAERQIARAETEAVANQRTTQALEAERFDTAVARLEADYPALNPESEVYDADLVELVLAKQNTLMRTEGLSPSQAMIRAASQVAERFLKAEEPAKDEKGLAAAKAAEDRKAAQIKKNLDTAGRQPASMKEAGIDSDKAGQTGKLPDVLNMTQDEFKALPASTLAKLRGDYV